MGCTVERIDTYVAPRCREEFNRTRALSIILGKMLGVPGEPAPPAAECLQLRALDGSGRMLGFLELVLTEDGGAWIHFMYVHKQCRGRGIGSRLVDRAIELARRWQRSYLAAVVADETLRALGLDVEPEAMRRLLQKRGFRHDGYDKYVLELGDE